MSAAFVIRHLEGRDCPKVRCERCGDDIDFAMAGIVWNPVEKTGSQDNAVIVLCKRKTTRGCLSAPEYERLPWMDLTRFLLDAMHNGGLSTLNLKAAIKRRDDLYRAGYGS